MKKFPIKFNNLIIAMFIIILLILLTVIVYNFVKISESGFNSYTIAISSIFIVLSVLLLIFLISVSFFSKYKVLKESLYICIGFIRIKLEIQNIDRIVIYEKNSESFIFYTKNQNKKTHLICMEFDKQREFIDLLKDINKNIIFVIEDGFNNP